MALPLLDDPCGRYFRYRDIIECGPTWERLARERPGFDNTPTQDATYAAMRLLCESVLDPVAENFGRENLILTYGHASADLQREIARTVKGIASKLDQHAGHEMNRRSEAICKRLGQSVDFTVSGLDSTEVANWILLHTRFDRLYFYGPERPVHCSSGLEPARSAWLVVRGCAPRRLRSGY